jgi:hypothetical protein
MCDETAGYRALHVEAGVARLLVDDGVQLGGHGSQRAK